VVIPWDKELEEAALAWSHEKTKRCGRTAYQFSKNWIGRYLLARLPK
jgi:predicted AAA+ superfamily ATPase